MDLEEIRAAAADLVLGAACVGCQRPGLVLCSRCSSVFAGLPYRTRPDPCPAGLPPVWALAAYADVARAALVAHKEEGLLALTRPLGRALAVSVMGLLAATSGLPERVRLVPVPSRRAVARERGHDPLLRMTREAARTLRRAGVRAEFAQALRPRRDRELIDQAGLSAAERAANLAGAFTARQFRANRDGWVVVDDIITTGATALEATAALGAADLQVLGVAVVAATKRHTPTRPSTTL